MAKARITLLDSGPVSFTGNGRTLHRGESFITTTDSEILYWSRQSGISVEMVEGRRPKGPVAAEDSEDTDEDGEMPSVPSKAKATVESKPAKPTYTAEELQSQTKSGLLEIIEHDGLTVDVDSSNSKAQIIAAILAAQPADEE